MMPTLNLVGGWIGILAGVLSGGLIGLFFHQETWMGGYASYRRRLMRLGHVAFFGLGFLNIAFAATSNQLFLQGRWLAMASWLLIFAAASMPVCCFLAAWRKPLRHLFPIPVLSMTTGLLAILIGGFAR
jgi:predicted exporter